MTNFIIFGVFIVAVIVGCIIHAIDDNKKNRKYQDKYRIIERPCNGQTFYVVQKTMYICDTWFWEDVHSFDTIYKARTRFNELVYMRDHGDEVIESEVDLNK